MSRRAQDRIRMYFYKTKEELLKTNEIALPQKQLQALILDLNTRLKMNKFHGYYFDRACAGNENMKSICDIWGTFTCQGRWDKDKCLYHPPHSINPYVSREARIIFQTWNLDHNKERSRSITPAIRSALRACGADSYDYHRFVDGRGRNVENGKICGPLKGQIVLFGSDKVLDGQNVILVRQNENKEKIVVRDRDEIDENIKDQIVTYVSRDQNVENQNVKGIVSFGNVNLDVKAIYDDLFTVANLKLVHIVCHDKGAHGTRVAGPYFTSN